MPDLPFTPPFLPRNISHRERAGFNRTVISSSNNPRIKDIIKLRKADYRRKTRTFIIEGYRELARALSSRIKIRELYFCPELFSKGDEARLIGQAQERSAQLFEVSCQRIYAKIAFGNRREGLIAVGVQPKLSLADIPAKANPLFVVVERIEKPGNLGAIIRTAEAAGADGVIVSDELADIYNPQVVRSSMGALFTLCVAQAGAREAILWLRARGIRIICACVQGQSTYTSIDFRQPSAIVLGSEERGLSGLWKEGADFKAAIPMAGSADSLNVSCAAGILLFEAVRQRRFL